MSGALRTRPVTTSRPAGRRRPPGPDPARLAGALATVWLEVAAGRRPLAQLDPLVTPALQRRLGVLLHRLREPRDHVTSSVRRVIVSWPSDHACEACVLVEQGGRTTAFAVRLERRAGVWRASELTAPEAGLRALPPGPPEPDEVRDAFDEAADEARRRA